MRAFSHNFRDAALRQTIALPAAPGTVLTANIDTGIRTARASFVMDDIEAVLKIPPMTVVQVPDTKTITLVIESAIDTGFTVIDTLRQLVLTGAGGLGLPGGNEVRISLPSDVKRYLRGKVIAGALTGDCSAITAEFCLVK